jgi:hypothetical protein
MTAVATGALVGWERNPAAYGIILRMQILTTRDDEGFSNFVEVQVALNDRQLRSLARDLRRAADERGLQLRPARRWWQLRKRL